MKNSEKEKIISQIENFPDWQFKPDKGLTREGLIEQVRNHSGDIKISNGLVVFL